MLGCEREGDPDNIICAVATDVPATLLSQLEGTSYRFR
jgi:hypothetical protein